MSKKERCKDSEHIECPQCGHPDSFALHIPAHDSWSGPEWIVLKCGNCDKEIEVFAGWHYGHASIWIPEVMSRGGQSS
jgi:hypothetical protein